MKTRSFIAALLVAAGLAGCGASTPTAPDSGSLARVDTLMRSASGALPIALKLSAEQIRLGDTLGASVTPGVSGHVYLIQVGTDGRTQSLLFPNAIDGANFVPAGSTLQLPRPNWRMTARGPAGVGYFIAVLSVQPLDLMALQASVSRGELAVPGSYGAAMATLRETAP
jgi:hypothetical protein